MLEVALAALGSLSSSFQPSHGAFVGVTHSKIRASHGARGRVRVWSDPMAVGRGNEFRQAILQSGKVIVMGHSNDDCQSSHIVSVTSNNLAGMINNDDKESSGIQIDFGSEPCFVAVTGECIFETGGKI